MSVTATELKKNLSYYIDLSSTQDILVTRNGKVVARLTSPFRERIDDAKDLFGSVPEAMTLEESREERLSKL